MHGYSGPILFFCEFPVNKSSSRFLFLLLQFAIHFFGRFQLPIDRLWVSVFKDDDEAFAFWRDEASFDC